MNRGGFLTRKCLLEPVGQACRELGGTVSAEYPVRLGQTRGYVDLWVNLGPCPVAIEGELGIKRLENDLHKALALRALLLLIVVPNWAACRSARKAMARILELRRRSGLTAPTDPVVLILPVGPAIQRLRQINDFVTRSLSDLSQNHKIIPAKLQQALAGSNPERSKS
jgi:hypothetical protein